MLFALQKHLSASSRYGAQCAKAMSPSPGAGKCVTGYNKRFLSSSSSSTGSSTRFATEAERNTYLRNANNEMKRYDDARERFRRGEFKNQSANKSSFGSVTQVAQLGVATFFLVAFLSTPFLGKKIAQDEDFRKKYVPSWYDYTVPKPEKPWTRHELHEQMLQVQQDSRQRAIAGEFTPEKLQQMQNSMNSNVDEQKYYPHREGMDRSKIPKAWDRIHPDLDEDDEDE